MSDQSPTTKRRVQFDFSDDAYTQLEELQEALELPTKIEVVRRAIGLLEEIINMRRRGEILIVENPDGTRERIHFIGGSYVRA